MRSLVFILVGAALVLMGAWWSPWVVDTSGFLSPISGKEVAVNRARVEKTANATLTEDESRNTMVTNQGASGEVDLVLDAISYGVAVTFIVEETQVIEVNPPSGEAFDLNGTTLDADDVVDSDTTVGSKLVATRMKNASGTWIWSLDSVRGSWTDSGATD